MLPVELRVSMYHRIVSVCLRILIFNSCCSENCVNLSIFILNCYSKILLSWRSSTLLWRPWRGFTAILWNLRIILSTYPVIFSKWYIFFFLIIFQKLSPSATQAIGQSVSQDEVKDLTDSRISPDVIERKSLHSTEVGEHVSFITLQFRCNCCLLVDPNQHNVCVG